MATTSYPGVTNSASQESWKFQDNYVERIMDHNALSSAHPDDTLILAGPPRVTLTNPALIFDKLLPIGMVQQMQVTQQKPTTPMQAIGSGRLFFVSGKAQGSASIARLFVNGRNLLRALYTNAVQSGIDVTKFDDQAAFSSTLNKAYMNLDSELFLIPFGLAVFFRDKVHDEIASFYLELCHINTWAIAVNAGQTMVLENVNMLFDRLMPISASNVGLKTTSNYNPADAANSTLFKTIFQSESTTPIAAGAGNGQDTVNSNY